MVRLLSWTTAVVMVVAGVSVMAVRERVRAQGLPVQQEGRPGYPSLATVMVLNKRPEEAVPVSIEANRFGPLPVAVTTTVGTVANAQRWEYRSVRIKTGDDPIGPLNAAGTDGWEAISTMAVPDGAVILLKRPRP
ncbi:MAG TPA: hypothetical protein VFO19_18230 [Vicinamibacterales bacterium]|nr:hypothetical protein [Vicinamibacterales bacterium]